MSKTIRKVILPDGRKAKEIEYHFIGGSETQLGYAYKRFGFTVNKNKFKREYWGRIEGLRFI